MLTTSAHFAHESNLIAWHHVRQILLQNLLLHGVHALHERLELHMELHHLSIFSIALLFCHGLTPLMLGDKLCKELLLSDQRQPLHCLVKFYFLGLRHQFSYLVELLLKFLSVLETLGFYFLFCLLVVLLFLVCAHAVDDLLDLRLNLLKSFMCGSKLTCFKLLGSLILSEVSQGIIYRHH